jgi:hypothetical protein
MTQRWYETVFPFHTTEKNSSPAKRTWINNLRVWRGHPTGMLREGQGGGKMPGFPKSVTQYFYGTL